jgi:hypothetical protein
MYLSFTNLDVHVSGAPAPPPPRLKIRSLCYARSILLRLPVSSRLGMILALSRGDVVSGASVRAYCRRQHAARKLAIDDWLPFPRRTWRPASVGKPRGQKLASCLSCVRKFVYVSYMLFISPRLFRYYVKTKCILKR